jgi:hypothetical protein
VYNSYCNADTPYPSVSHESVPSLIDNLVNALYGAITKDVSSGKVVWNIPCDPANIPATINNIPRNAGEGLLCYIIRALNLTGASGIVTVNGTQTLTNKTLDATCSFLGNATTATNIAGGTAGKVVYQTGVNTTGFTDGGTSGQVLVSNGTSAPTWSTNISGQAGSVANASVSPAKLTTGGPSWDVNGNLTSSTVALNSSLRIHANNQTNNSSALAGIAISAFGGGWTLDVPQSSTYSNPLIVSNGNGTIERLRINSSGNVGIGTPSPNQKLDVSGNINASGTITGSNTVNIANSYANIGLASFFVKSGSDRSIALFTTNDGINFSKLTQFPLIDQNSSQIFAPDPSIRYLNGKFYIVVGDYATNSHDFVICTSTNLIDWTRYQLTFGNPICVTNGNAPNYTQTFASGPMIWAPELFVDSNGTMYVIASIQCAPDQADVDGVTIPFFRQFIATCTNVNALTFSAATELNLGGTAVGNSAPTLNKIDSCIVNNGSGYTLFVKNEYSKFIEQWTNSSLTGAWTYNRTLFRKYCEGPSVCDFTTPAGSKKWFVYVDNYDYAQTRYVTTSDLTNYSSDNIINIGTRVRHGTVINLSQYPKQAIDALVSSSALLKGSYDPFAYGVAKAWVNFNGVLPLATGKSYTRSGTTVTVTSTAHGYLSGAQLVISSATDSALNGRVTITVTNANTFTFTTSATGANGTLSYNETAFRSSYNVSSVTFNGSGDYTINFEKPMMDTGYAVSLGTVGSSLTNTQVNAVIAGTTAGGATTKTTTQLRIQYGSTAGIALYNCAEMNVVIFGN